MKTQDDKLKVARPSTLPGDLNERSPTVDPGKTKMISRRVKWLEAAGIFLLVTGLVAISADDLGLTWDEVPYRASQEHMAEWFRRLAGCRSLEHAKPLFSKQSILTSWEYNRYGPNFHPPLAGTLSNLTWAAFGKFLGDLPARRVASGAELGLAAAVLFVFLARRYSPWVGGVAAASLVLMPRVFGDAHITGTDMPLMAFWAFTALAFWNGLESRGWRIGFGVLLGLSLLVKFTALLVVVPLVVWLVSYRALSSWRPGNIVAAVLGTAIVGWPLAVAGVEIVRLADAIRRHTQQERMLSPTIAGLAGGMLMKSLEHAPPYAPDELKQAASDLLESAATIPAGSLDAMIARETADAVSHAGAQPSFNRSAIETILENTVQQVYLQHFKHGPPYSETELKQAAALMLEESATRNQTSLAELIGHAEPFSVREIRWAAGRLQLSSLALDQYVAYVMPKQDLGVRSRFQGWLFFLPLVMWLAWCLTGSLPWSPAWLRETGGGVRLWLAGLAIAPAVAIALNPTWWHETLPQLAHFYQISVGRQGSLPDIEIFYLAKKHVYSLPWHNGWLLTAVTVPTAILACALVGIASAFWHVRRDPLRMFFLINLVTLPISRMLPIPAHDGVRLMLPTFFFLAGMAGWGFEWLERLVERFRSEEYSTSNVLTVAWAFLLLPPTYWLYRSHPHELSYYNGLVGGLPGAQRLGFEPTYWYDAVTPEVLDGVNDAKTGLPTGATLSLPEPQSILEAIAVPGTREAQLLADLPGKRINPDVFIDLWQRRQLRMDIRLGGFYPRNIPATEFPYVALLTHSSKASPYTRLLYAFKPYASWDHDGVRLFSLYDPQAVARVWALWVLVDATDYSKPDVHPRVDRELIELARTNYRALFAAALKVTQDGLDQALESQEDPEITPVIRRLAERRKRLQVLFGRRQESLIEAVEILGRTMEKRPSLMERLIETYDGYLPAAELGDYIDAGYSSVTP